MYLTILILTLTNFDARMWKHNPHYNNSYATVNFCAVYRQTADALLIDYEQYEYDASVLETFAEIAEEYEGETEKTAIITSDEATQCWYDGVTGANSAMYRLDENEFPEIIAKLQAQEIEWIIVNSDSGLEQGQTDIYMDYFEKCQTVEKDGILICSAVGNGWTDTAVMRAEDELAKCELFELTAEGGQYESAPLLADQTSYLDYILYQNITGKSMEDFYTWHYEPVDNIKRLNEQEIHYIVLLYDDAYYQKTQTYFDGQTIVFQNEAGCILTHSGDVWSTSY